MSLIGASRSEPHTSELNRDFSVYIILCKCIYLLYVIPYITCILFQQSANLNSCVNIPQPDNFRLNIAFDSINITLSGQGGCTNNSVPVEGPCTGLLVAMYSTLVWSQLCRLFSGDVAPPQASKQVSHTTTRQTWAILGTYQSALVADAQYLCMYDVLSHRFYMDNL